MTTAHAVNEISEVEAAALWRELRSAFVNLERIVTDIIAYRAWEPLGYETFTEAWAAKMGGIRLASTELRARVVYAMFNDGLNVEQVASQFGVGSGVTPEAVDYLKRQADNGVPPEAADITVRRHKRRKAGPPRRIVVEVTAAEMSMFKRKAKANGVDINDVFLTAGREAFKGMPG